MARTPLCKGQAAAVHCDQKARSVSPQPVAGMNLIRAAELVDQSPVPARLDRHSSEDKIHTRIMTRLITQCDIRLGRSLPCQHDRDVR